MKTSTIQWVRGENAQILTQLVREHRELVDQCRDFSDHVWAFEYVNKKHVSTGTKEEGLDYLHRHPESIVSLSRNMNPQAFVSFTKALQEVIPQLYVTTHESVANLPVVVDVHPKPHFIHVGIPNGISYRLWSKEPQISGGGHPDWSELSGILEASDCYDYYRDEDCNLQRRLMSRYDPLQELNLRRVGQSLGGEHAPGGTTTYQVLTKNLIARGLKQD